MIILTEVIEIKGIVALIIVAAVFLTVPLHVSGASVRVDGRLLASEWDDARAVDVISRGEGSNCNVEYARLKAVIDNEENAVYFLFMSMCDGLEKGNTLCGVSVDIESSGAVTVCPGSEGLSLDNDRHSFNAVAFVGDNESFYCEMRVGFKHGVGQSIPVAVRFIDAEGELSTVYRHIIVNDEYSQPAVTTIILHETQPTEKTVTTKQVKTEITAVTKEKTTRERRTAATTVPRTKKQSASKKPTQAERTSAPQIIVNVIIPTSKVPKTSRVITSAQSSSEAPQSTTLMQTASQTQYVMYTENTAGLKAKRLAVSFASVAALGGISVLVMLGGRKGQSVAASADDGKGDDDAG